MPTKQLAPTPVRIPPDLKEWLKENAATNLRSVNAEIIALLLDVKRRSEEATTGK